jgi:hypothetical protein
LEASEQNLREVMDAMDLDSSPEMREALEVISRASDGGGSSSSSSGVSAKRHLKNIVLGSILGLSFSAFPSSAERMKYVPLFGPLPCVADSTGKFSTKLTARRRYLPRIQQGVFDFNAAVKGGGSRGATWAQSEDGLPKLKRAMGLYGASLRKGEIPDEISRQAEQLTIAFEKAGSVKGGRLDEKATRAALDAYLKFAGLGSSESGDYAAPPKPLK